MYCEYVAYQSTRERLQSVAKQIYTPIFEALSERHAKLGVFGSKDGPLSDRSCCLAVNSIDSEVMRQYGLVKTGGCVGFIHGNGFMRPHAYFTLLDYPEAILDPTSGQYANDIGISVNDWIQSVPDLFFRQILIGHKEEVSSRLGLVYPRENVTFSDFFLKGRKILL